VPSGSVLILPGGFGEARFKGFDFELICVELDPTRVKKILGRSGPAAHGALTPKFGVNDLHILALLSNMAAEVAEGCPGGKLYAEALSLSLVAYLEGRFSTKKNGRNRPQRRFSERQTRLLVDCIHADLANELNLSILAKLVEMSPRQFFRAFANTFACTPHRYVLIKRVARAKELLSAGLPLVEIAFNLGFAGQSHFTHVFQRTTGISPGRFRRMCSTARSGVGLSDPWAMY
jgi:AraC family transcriptional regulator